MWTCTNTFTPFVGWNSWAPTHANTTCTGLLCYTSYILFNGNSDYWAALEVDTVQLWGQGNVLGHCEFSEALVFVQPGLGLAPKSRVFILHLLQVCPLLRLFVLQLILLLDPFDSATGRVSSVFEGSPSLFHPHDLVPCQSSHLERAIQVTHGYGNQLIVADVRNGTGRKGGLQLSG